MENKKKNILIIFFPLIIIILIIGLLVLHFYYNNQLNNTQKKYISKLEEATGSNKKAITIEKFKYYIEEEGFDLYSPQEANLSSNFLYSIKDGSITYNKADKEFRINFFEFKNEDASKYAYYNYIVNDYKNSKELLKENSLHYNKYATIIDGKYEIISIIENTCIWGTIKAENQAELDRIINELGY